MSKTIIRVNKKENPFVMIDKTFLYDSRISWKAKGILAYLMSKPDDWKVIVKDLVKQSTDGEKSVYSGLRELEKNGYVTRRRLRDECGKFKYMEYIVYEQPVSNHCRTSDSSTSPFSSCGETSCGKSSLRKRRTTNNTTLLNNNITKKDNNKNGTYLINNTANCSKPTNDLEVDVQKLILQYQNIFNTENIPYNVFGLIQSKQDVRRMQRAINYLKTHYVDQQKIIKNLPGLLKAAYEQSYSVQAVHPINLKHHKHIQKRQRNKSYSVNSYAVEEQKALFRQEVAKIFGEDVVKDILNKLKE